MIQSIMATRLRSAFLFLYFLCAPVVFSEESLRLACSVSEENERDPALKQMNYDFGNGEKTMWAYVEPEITSFYQGHDTIPASKKVVPKYTGLCGKFINLSSETVRMYWEARIGDSDPILMNILGPFEVSGTATFTGHYFFFATDDDDDDNRKILKRWTVGDYPENIYAYDPYYVKNDPRATEANLAHLTPMEREDYNIWRNTFKFNEQYLNFTGRTYLANYLRKPPMHFMWRADYFGQQHWVTTKETHFNTVPPQEKLAKIEKRGIKRILKPEDPPLLAEYRVPDQTIMNMTLTALSCAPRVFEIQNFLSEAEVDHILDVAAGVTLERSLVGNIGSGSSQATSDTSETRTSLNSWVERERTPVIDAVYRRAADLLRINEALFRSRGPGEHEGNGFKSSLAENLQLVHYDPGQEYTAHHDFGFSLPNTSQGTRFATLLLYLNDGMVGGETSFPRWVNAERFDELRVSPEAGKAVLFYSQLPDGNLDDFSHHAALPVREGEKWLINLWVWDPVMEEDF